MILITQVPRERPSRGARASLCAIFATLCLLASGAQCQVSDADEQFEFQHQDIGRISGMSSGSSQVAPQTIVSRSHQPASEPLLEDAPAPVPAPVARTHFSPPQASPPRQSTQVRAGQRKPNRVTLVARRDPVPVATLAPASQLAAPQAQPHFQIAPSSFDLVQPTFAPLMPQHQPAQQSAPLTVSGPVLSSARATGGSVSARHSALIAQVAAERATAAAILPPGDQTNSASFQQPFNSPAAAATSAALSLPPPTPQAPLHQHQPSAFASFAAPTASVPQQQFQAPAQTQAQSSFANLPEEPLVAPSFEHVLGNGCPHKGVFSWDNRDHCDRYYMCTNGTFTEEACPNGLAYSQTGAVYQHCAYNWNVECGRKKTAQPIASPGCPWQFGIFPIVQNGRCSIDYFVCEWGVPDTKRCSPEGLFYDDRIKGCQWADQLGCKSEALLNFKCPPEDEDNPYWPYPRYYHNTQDVIVCVNEQPRLVHCNEDQLVDPGSLACMDINKKKKNKKPL